MKLRNVFALILALTVVFTFAACGSDESQRKDKSRDDRVQTEDRDGKNLLTYLVLQEAVTYDAEGNVTQYIKVDRNSDNLPESVSVEGERGGTLNYTYASQYAVATLDYKETNGDGEYYEFNTFGDNVKKDTYKAGVLDSTIAYTYDDGQRVIGRVHRNPNNAKKDKDIAYAYKLDDRGQVIEELEYVDGEEYFIKEMQYDDLGREIRYSGAYIGREPYIRESEYDDKGNLKKTTEYTGDVQDAYTEYFYDDQGRLLKYVTMASGVEVDYEEYLYDERGNVIKFSYYRDHVQRCYEYEYDQDNRLTKDYYYVEGELIRYTEYTWYDQSVHLEKNVALAIQREFILLKEQ